MFCYFFMIQTDIFYICFFIKFTILCYNNSLEKNLEEGNCFAKFSSEIGI